MSSEIIHYQRSQQEQQASGTWLERLWATLELWSQRAHQRKQIRRLNADQLKDIGISATDAYREGSKPFWQS